MKTIVQKNSNQNHKSKTNWLSDKTVLITGASSGSGEEGSERLVGTCGKLILVARGEARKLDELAENLNRIKGGPAKHTEIKTHSLDICQRDKAVDLISKIYDDDGDQIDVFINCAGGTHVYGTFESMSHEDIDQIFDTNAKAPIFWLRELLPRMKRNAIGTGSLKRAHVVMLSSRSAERTLPKLSVYTAAKGAVEKLVEAMQKEYAQYRIVFTLINPGSINTAFTEKWDAKFRDAHNEESMTVNEAISPILEALNSQIAINKISYQSIQQWFNEPGVLIDP